jgi:outer membrane protein TolC
MPRRRPDVRLHLSALLPAIVFAMACISAPPVGAQDTPAVLSLSQCIDAAFSSGTDIEILLKNLAVSREQYGMAVSQSAYSLSAAFGENATYGYGNGTLLAVSSLGSGFNQTPQAGLTLATPTTSLGFSTTPYVAASPLGPVIAALSGGPLPGASGTFGVNLGQVLWNGYPGGTARAALDKSLLALRGRELSVGTGKLAITSAVTQAYFLALGAQRNIVIRRQVLEQQNALLAQMRAIRVLQQATDVDLRTAEINAQSAEIELQGAVTDLRITRIRLAQLIGLPRDREFTVAEAEDPAVPVATVEDAISEALARRTEVQQIALNRQSSDIDRELIKGQTLPTLSVTGGATLIHDWNLGTNAGQGSLGVKVGLPILDAGAADHQLDANRLQNEVYAAQDRQVRASIGTDVEEAFNLLQIQLQRLQVARLNAEKLDLQFKMKKTSAQFGTATNQDLLDASVNAGNAQAALVAAQRNAQLAVLQLRNAMGY